MLAQQEAADRAKREAQRQQALAYQRALDQQVNELRQRSFDSLQSTWNYIIAYNILFVLSFAFLVLINKHYWCVSILLLFVSSTVVFWNWNRLYFCMLILRTCFRLLYVIFFGCWYLWPYSFPTNLVKTTATNLKRKKSNYVIICAYSSFVLVWYRNNERGREEVQCRSHSQDRCSPQYTIKQQNKKKNWNKVNKNSERGTIKRTSI